MTLFAVCALAWVLFVGALDADELGARYERERAAAELVDGWEVVHL